MTVFIAMSDFAAYNLDMLRELYEIFSPAARSGRYELELLQAFKAVFASDAFRGTLPSRVQRPGEGKGLPTVTGDPPAAPAAPAVTPTQASPAKPAPHSISRS